MKKLYAWLESVEQTDYKAHKLNQSKYIIIYYTVAVLLKTINSEI